jgi:intracellular septation protein
VDKRLVIEFLPGVAFLAGNALGGLFAGAGLAAGATVIAVALRWHWDRSLPWMAVSIFALTLILLLAGLALEDATFVKVAPTVGSLAFAAIIGVGMMLRPGLVQRTLGYRLALTPQGWRMLEASWIGVSLLRAGANEVVWRNASDQAWAVYNGVSDVLWIGLFYLATSAVAHRFWQEAEPGAGGPAHDVRG